MSNNKTLNTKTTATLPNVIGKIKKDNCLPNFESNGIFDSNNARLRPPTTFMIAENAANVIVLNSEDEKPFE